jgi:hypothetical protein
MLVFGLDFDGELTVMANTGIHKTSARIKDIGDVDVFVKFHLDYLNRRGHANN